MIQVVEYIKNLFPQTDETEGQGLVEYALIIALVAILLVAALTGLKDAIAGVFSNISGSL
jgi:pilus assembly protein Flp/PilA